MGEAFMTAVFVFGMTICAMMREMCTMRMCMPKNIDGRIAIPYPRLAPVGR